MNLVERFLKYVAVYTHSARDIEKDPTTEMQWDLAKILVEDMKALGMEDARVDQYCRVYGTYPASKGWEDVPAIGFIAHMDTVCDAPGDNIKTKIVHYEGGDIVLSEGIVTSPADFPNLNNYVGHDLIVTDGTTLLGADDKAGIAEALDLIQRLGEHPEIEHRKIALCFTPDEEVGRGPLHFDYEHFGAPAGYTIDGGALGGICYENFNAAGGTLKIHGFNIHPGAAKNKMKNAVKLAAKFIMMMPDAESPEHTEGYEGYYHAGEVNGNESEASVRLIIRDHDRASFEARKVFLNNLVAYLNTVHGEGTFELELKDSYYNMKEMILPHMELIDNAVEAMKAVGATPRIEAARGGTDGATISYGGIPCPNLSTGGENAHGVKEFASVQDMGKMVDVLQYIATSRK
ncbi:MAG: peptidase T [Firmicutes bacterium]|nr:peptidase T [Bacillota bacterium]